MKRVSIILASMILVLLLLSCKPVINSQLPPHWEYKYLQNVGIKIPLPLDAVVKNEKYLGQDDVMVVTMDNISVDQLWTGYSQFSFLATKFSSIDSAVPDVCAQNSNAFHIEHVSKNISIAEVKDCPELMQISHGRLAFHPIVYLVSVGYEIYLVRLPTENFETHHEKLLRYSLYHIQE